MRGMSFLRSVAEGVEFVRGKWALRALLQLLAVVMLLGMPFQTLLPIFVHGHHTMGGSHSHGIYAALLSAVGLGGFVGSLFGMASGEGSRPGLPLLSAAAGLGVSILLLVSSDVIHWASLAAFFAGACAVLAVNLDMALVEGLTPVELQGRVSAIASLGKGLQSFSPSVLQCGRGQWPDALDQRSQRRHLLGLRPGSDRHGSGSHRGGDRAASAADAPDSCSRQRSRSGLRLRAKKGARWAPEE